MRPLICLSAALALLSSLLGCGGTSDTLGTDSNMTVHVRRSNGTQDMSKGFEVYLTHNGDFSLNLNDPQSYTSTVHKAPWADKWVGTKIATELAISFRTRGNETPYYVFVRVPNTGNATEVLQ